MEKMIEKINNEINLNLEYTIECLKTNRFNDYEFNFKEQEDYSSLESAFEDFMSNILWNLENDLQYLQTECDTKDEDIISQIAQTKEAIKSLDNNLESYDHFIKFYEENNRKYAKMLVEIDIAIDYYEENTTFNFECDGIFTKNFYEYDICEELYEEDNFEEIINELSKWKDIYKSPFSNSFYDKEVDWDFKPDKVKRISDHWNFESHGTIHCKTNYELENGNYHLGIYNSNEQCFEIEELELSENYEY